MSYTFGNASDQLDKTTVMLRATKQGLETGHDRLNTLRNKVLPKMERKLVEAEHSFHRTLKLFDMPIPRITPQIPVGLLAGAAALLLIGSTVGLMMYVDSKKDGEPKEVRRRRKPKSKTKIASRPRPRALPFAPAP